MKKIIISLLFIFSFVFFVPTFIGLEANVFAQQIGTDCYEGQTGEDCGDVATGASIKLKNPLGENTNSIPKLVESFLNIVLTIGVPIIAMAIIYSGYLFVAAQGNPEKLKIAKRNLVYVVIGAAILLAAYAIANVVVSTIEAIRG